MLSDTDVSALWSRMDKYHDPNTGTLKVGVNDMCMLLAEFNERAEASALWQQVRSYLKSIIYVPTLVEFKIIFFS